MVGHQGGDLVEEEVKETGMVAGTELLGYNWSKPLACPHKQD